MLGDVITKVNKINMLGDVITSLVSFAFLINFNKFYFLNFIKTRNNRLLSAIASAAKPPEQAINQQY